MIVLVFVHVYYLFIKPYVKQVSASELREKLSKAWKVVFYISQPCLLLNYEAVFYLYSITYISQHPRYTWKIHY